MQERSPKTAEDVSRTVDDATRERSVVDASSQGDVLVIPVVAEELAIETARITRGAVRLHKRVETSEQAVDTPQVREEVIVERVAVDRPVEGAAPEPREEDGVLVIPVLEEIAVVEKRLILREEIRVSRRRTMTSSPQVVTLRREVVEVERVDADTGTHGNPRRG